MFEVNPHVRWLPIMVTMPATIHGIQVIQISQFDPEKTADPGKSSSQLTSGMMGKW